MIRFRPYKWAIHIHDEKQEILAWCKSENNESGILRFQDFKIPCFLELPSSGSFADTDWALHADALVQQLNNQLRATWSRGRQDVAFSRIHGTYVEQEPLFFCTEHHKKSEDKVAVKRGGKLPFLRVEAASDTHLRKLQTLTARPIEYIDAEKKRQSVTLVMWEGVEGGDSNYRAGTSLGSITKLLVALNCSHTQWLAVDSKHQAPPAARISRATHEMVFSYAEARPLSDKEAVGLDVQLRIFDWDIETYTPHHDNMPNYNLAQHVITNIVAMVYDDGDVEQVEGQNPKQRFISQIAFTVRDARKPLPYGTTIVRCRNEKELLTRFVAHLADSDPDVFTGFNLTYDWGYLHARLTRHGIAWPEHASRLLGVMPERSKNETIKITPKITRSLVSIKFPGRITLDVYHMTIREYGWLPTHKLNTISQLLLERGKHDVTPREMFLAHERYEKARARLTRIVRQWLPVEGGSEGDGSEGDGGNTKGNSADGKQHQWIHYDGERKWLPEFHPNVSADVIAEVLREYDASVAESDRINAYCEEDVMLCADIASKINMFRSLLEQSGVYGVQPDEVYTRGEQMRAMAKIYRAAKAAGIVIDKRDIGDFGGAAGGHVGNMRPGIYPDVLTLDFKSMYPSIIIRFNICYTTYVRPRDEALYAPDDLNVIEWDQQAVEITEKGGRRKKTKLFNADGSPQMVHHRHCFVKPHIKKGLLPQLVADLVASRNAVKKQMDAEKDPKLKQVYNIRQNSYKTASNAMYGIMGIGTNGKLPFIIGSMCTAARGRELIQRCNSILVEDYGATIVYNDTDSTMFQLPNISNGREMVQWGRKLEKEISARFEAPLYFEFEKCGVLYGLTAKKYIYWLTDLAEKVGGKENPHFGELKPLESDKSFLMKGNSAVRRDASKMVKKLYWKIVRLVFSGASLQSCLDTTAAVAVDLKTQQVAWRELVYSGSIGRYTSDTATGAVYAKRLNEMGKPAAPGDRYEYVVVESDLKGKANHMMPTDLFADLCRKKDPSARPDIPYYIGTLGSPIDQLLGAAYNDELEQKAEKSTDSLFSDIMALVHEKIAEKRSNKRCRKIIEPAIPEGAGAQEVFALYLLNKTTAALAKQARSELLTGRTGETVRRNKAARFTVEPVAALGKAAEGDFFVDALRSVCSKDQFAVLHNRLENKAAYGNWQVEI